MIIRAIKTYLACMLFVGGMYAVTSCSREEGPLGNMEEEAGKPIELLASPQWPDQTKAPINSVGDLLGSGFVVWGAWAQDPADKAQFSGDYSSGTTNKVFGQNGTKVYATDGDGNGTFAPVAYTGSSNPGQIDHWAYSPTRYWHRGTYNFAAVLPEGDFGASYGKDGAETGYTGELAINPSGNPVLTINFGESGFRLGELQTDLMVAFDYVDNKNESATSVSLKFEHQLAMIKFEALATDLTVDIDKIELTSYKNTAKSAAFEWIKPSDTEETGTVNPTWTLDESQTGSSHNNGGGGWKQLATSTKSLFEWLVLPQTVTGAQCIITYTEHFYGEAEETKQSVSKTINATIPQVTWEPFKTYLYRFTVTAEGIKFNAPIVTNWVNGAGETFPTPEM